MEELIELLHDKEIRPWLWWTIIPLSIVGGLVIISIVEKFFDRNNTRQTSKYARGE